MKEIFIERQKKLLRIAIRENNKLKECFLEEEKNTPYPGEIYKGIVKNIVPAIKCAFIDIGYQKNAYMYLDSKFKNLKLKKGQELLVEVIKEELGDKGAKVTSAISIPGRYAVLSTLNRDLTFSQKIEEKEFMNLGKQEIRKPEDVGILIRTNAQKVDFSLINGEIERIYGLYKELLNEAQHIIKPKLLYTEESAVNRVIRDMVDENTKTIFVDTLEDYEKIKEFIAHKTDIKTKIEIHKEIRSLFDYYDIEREILSLRNDKVMLHCGGYLIINKTEAMYVIDVNSGKNVKDSSIEKTALTTNLEAAEEIGRQIRLRNLNGIIVVDFIDMNSVENQNQVLQVVKDGFEDDKNKTVVYPFTELSLVQIARRRRGKPIYEYIEEPCSSCRGKGKRIRLSYMTLLLKNKIMQMNNEHGVKNIYIELDESYKKEITGNVLNFIKEIEALDKSIYVNFVKDMEHFKIEPLLFANQLRNLQVFKIYG